MADFDPDSLLDTPPPASATMTIRPKLSPAMQDILNQVIAPGESAGAYNVIYGGKKIDDLSHHPDIPVPIKSGPNAGDVSTAAGKYQFINSTWKEAEKALGLKDFGPDSQDAAAAWLAKKTYAEKTGGRDIEADYASGDPSLKAGIRRALASQWESLDKAAPRSQLMTVGNDRYRFNDDLFKDDNVHLMSPEDYLALAPPMEDTPAATKQWRDLRASVGAGEPIFKAPTLNIAAEGSTGTVTAQDGRNRALLAQESGLDAIPVKINQTGDGTPSRFVGMTGNVVPAHDIAPANTAGLEKRGQSLLARLGVVGSAEAAEPVKSGATPPKYDWADPVESAEPEQKVAGQYDWADPVTAPGAIDHRDWDLTNAQYQALQQSRRADATVPLQNDPNKTYGTILPFARDNTTGALEWAVPGALRPIIRGASEGGQEALGERPVGDPRVAGDVAAAASLGAGVGGRVPGSLEAGEKPAATDMFRPMYELVSRIAGKDIADNPGALKIVGRLEASAKAGGPTAQDIIDLMNAAPKDAPLTLSDLGGENVMALAGKMSRSPGAARQIMNALKDRMSGSQSRLINSLDKGVGEGSSFDAAEALKQARTVAADPLYKDAFAQPVTIDQVRPVQRIIQDPIGQEAIQKGMRVAELETLRVGSRRFFNPEDYGVVKGDGGKWIVDPDVVAGKKAPSLRFLDAVKRGYDDIISELPTDPVGRPIMTQYSRQVNAIRKDYVGYLRNTFPKYGEALNAWSGPSSSLDAMKAGQGFIRQRPEEIAARLADLTDNDKEFYKLGAADALRKQFMEKGIKSPAGRAVAGGENQWVRDQLRPLFKSDDEFNQFVNSVETEGRMAGTNYDVFGNSSTARRMAEDADSPVEEAAGHAARGAVAASHGNYLGAAWNGARAMLSLRGLRDPEINAEIAKILVTPLQEAKGRLNFLAEMMKNLPATRNYLSRGSVPPPPPPGAGFLVPGQIGLQAGVNNSMAPRQ